MMDVLRRLRSRVDAMVSRAVINRVNDALKTQRVQLTILEGDIEDQVEMMQPYGLSFTPPNGAEALVLAVGGARSHSVALMANKPGDRPTGAPSGTGGLYTAGEWRLFVDANGIVHLGVQAGAAPVARADLVDAEIQRIWDVLTSSSIVPAPSSPPDAGEPGLTTLVSEASTASGQVQSTAATKAKVT